MVPSVIYSLYHQVYTVNTSSGCVETDHLYY